MEQDFEKKDKDIEKEYPAERIDFDVEKEYEQEMAREEIEEQKEKIKTEMEKEIEKVKLSSQTKTQAQQQADDMKKQTVEGKIKHLLELAQTQGLAYSVEVAKKMNDAYLLDLFHDELERDGKYKKYV